MVGRHVDLDSMAAHADLDIETVGACWRCRTCDRDLDRGAVLRCPVCGGPGRLQGGDEIILDRIEMEVS